MRDLRLATRYRRADQPPPALEEITNARALGSETALAAPVPEVLDRASEHLQHKLAEVWTAFDDGFAAAVGESEERRSVWTAFLREEVKRALLTPERLLLGPGIDTNYIDAASRAWSEESDPLSVWGRNHDASFSYRGETPFFQLSLLLLIDPIGWCDVIDSLPSPGVMKLALVLYTNLREDRDLITTLLRIAPSVFDSEGRWVASRSVVALLVSTQIVEHAKSLHDAMSNRVNQLAITNAHSAEISFAEGELRALERDELPQWMHEALSTLAARPDGRYLAPALLGHLGRNELLGRDQVSNRGWRAEQQAFSTLATILTSHGVIVRDMREAWQIEESKAGHRFTIRRAAGTPRPNQTGRHSEEQGEGARTLRSEGLPFLYGAAVMLGSDPQSADELETLWAWFEELLVQRDPGLSLIRHGSSIVDVPQRLGFLLSRTREPASLFRSAYIKLEGQRRRSAFAYRYQDFDQDFGSTLLVRVGLNAIVNWISRDPVNSAVPARALFWWLFDAIRRLWLTEAHDYEDKKQDLVALGFAYMPAIFGDGLADGLRRAVPPIANNPRMLAEAGWFLWRNGVESERLVALLRDAGGDIERALQDAHDWAKLIENRSLHRVEQQENREFPRSLEDLAAALGLSLEVRKSRPLHDDPVEKGDALARSIPWGAALLKQLERDGCGLTRVDSLDAPGATWLVQATVPDELRNQFGLSSELRILVVHGQVRGRELRVAVQDPDGAAKVDPDLIVVVSDQPDLHRRLPLLAGPWGQRVAWQPIGGEFQVLGRVLRDQLPGFDLFDYRDPVRGTALIGRSPEVEDLAVRLLRGEAVGVVGLRKVGKSSLVRAVAEALDPIGARRGMFESLSVPLPEVDPEALVVSLDVQGVVGGGIAIVLDRLNTVFEDRLVRAGNARTAVENAGASVAEVLSGERVQVRSPANFDSLISEAAEFEPIDRFRALLRIAVDRVGLPVCFMLDEYDLLFEGYGGEPGVPGIEKLLSLLRAEAQTTGRISLALVGRDPSFLDAPLLGGFTNPLAGWARHMYLGPLERDATEELLRRLGKRVGLDVGTTTLLAAWEATGGHPLLTRQYGAAMFELARTLDRSSPVPTDPINAATAVAFSGRAAVQTICTEVRALLEARYPEATALLEALAQAGIEDAARTVLIHGGQKGRAVQVLTRFGLLFDAATRPWIPGIFREEFASSVPELSTSAVP